MKSMKGRRLEWKGTKLWHSVEKTSDERLTAKQVGILLGRLRRASGLAPADFRTMYPDTDYDRGIVFIKDGSAAGGVRRLFQRPKTSKFWEVDAGV